MFRKWVFIVPLLAVCIGYSAVSIFGGTLVGFQQTPPKRSAQLKLANGVGCERQSVANFKRNVVDGTYSLGMANEPTTWAIKQNSKSELEKISSYRLKNGQSAPVIYNIISDTNEYVMAILQGRSEVEVIVIDKNTGVATVGWASHFIGPIAQSSLFFCK